MFEEYVNTDENISTYGNVSEIEIIQSICKKIEDCEDSENGEETPEAASDDEVQSALTSLHAYIENNKNVP